MKKAFVLTFSLVIIILAFYIFLVEPVQNSNVIKNQAAAKSASAQKQVVMSPITEEQLPAFLMSTSLVQDLPKNANIELKTSTRTYTITKGSVKVGAPVKPDVTFTIPSRYINEIHKGFCQIMTIANNKRDLDIVLHISEVSAAWKYKSMLKYKDCIGF